MLDKHCQIPQDIIRGFFMDPNALSSLDPKLRETYEKVMGTGAAPLADPAPATENTQPATPAAPVAADAAPQQPSASDQQHNQGANATGATPPPMPELSTSSSPEAASNQDQEPKVVTISQSLPMPTADNQLIQPHGHSGLIKVFYTLGTIVFFVIYIFFWMKIFNISLPF
jgi:hypothetical protein